MRRIVPLLLALVAVVPTVATAVGPSDPVVAGPVDVVQVDCLDCPAIPRPGRPTLAVDAANGRAYATGLASTAVIDTATHRVEAELFDASAVAVDRGLGRVVASHGRDVVLLDGASLAEVARVDVGMAAAAVDVDADAHRAYLVGDDLRIVSTVDGARLGSVDLPEPGLSVAAVPGRAYVTHGSGNVTVVADGAVEAALDAGGETHFFLADADPGDGRVFAAHPREDVVVELSDGAVAGRIDVPTEPGARPEAIGVDPVRDRVHVLHHPSGEVTVVDADRGNVVTTSPPLRSEPRFVAVDRETGRGYVAAGSDGVFHTAGVAPEDAGAVWSFDVVET